MWIPRRTRRAIARWEKKIIKQIMRPNLYEKFSELPASPLYKKYYEGK